MFKRVNGRRVVDGWFAVIDTALYCPVCHKTFFIADGERYNYCPCCGTRTMENDKDLLEEQQED